MPVWLKRYTIIACDFTQIMFKFLQYLHVTTCLVFRSKWMKVSHPRQRTWL